MARFTLRAEARPQRRPRVGARGPEVHGTLSAAAAGRDLGRFPPGSARLTAFTESVVEEAALAWLTSAGWQVRNGAEIAPGEPAAERDDFGQVVLAQRLRDVLARLNPALPVEALEAP